MNFLVLYRELNCPVNKTIDTGQITNNNCNNNYMLFIFS